MFLFSPLLFRDGEYQQFDESYKGPGDQHAANDLSSPESIQSVDRPPLRHIDKYIRPEISFLTKRITVALLSCIGFIVMFGMRSLMGVANIEKVSRCSAYFYS